MGEQRFDGRVLPSQLGFGQQRMNLAVAHAVHERRLPPTFALGHQVVGIALRGRYAPAAQRTDDNRRVNSVDHLLLPGVQ